MNFPFYIARRYLFSKKSHNAINIISMISVCGVAVATMATVCALSVLDGFKSIVFDMFSSFDPELRIVPAKGKVFIPDDTLFLEIEALPEIDIISQTLEDNALVRFQDQQMPAVLKGVDDKYDKLTNFQNILIDGETTLKDEIDNNYAILGIALAGNLGVNPRFVHPLQIYAPRRNVPVNLSNPSASFNEDHAFIGGVFMLNQENYDENYVVVPIELTRSLFNYKNEVSALDIKLKDGASIPKVKNKIEKLLGNNYLVKDRFEQQEASFKMMNMEKWVVFMILCFILLIAVFNVVGSLSMLIIDKQDDISTLRNLGADSKLISQIFLFEGWLICALGAICGITLGVLICLGQQHFGWLTLGTGDNFVVSAYPVTLSASNVFIVLITALLIGFLSVQYPVRYLVKKMS